MTWIRKQEVYEELRVRNVTWVTVLRASVEYYLLYYLVYDLF